MQLNIKSFFQQLDRPAKIALGALAAGAAIATILPVVFKVFDSPSYALPPSAYREKIDRLCTLASKEQSRAESVLRDFGRAFEKARTVTEARDLIVNQVQQQISAAADLSTPLEALVPPSEYVPQQTRILNLLNKNIDRLRNYENELNLLSSPLQLVALVQTVPRAEMNADAITGRGMLLALGGGGCELRRWPVLRVVDWSPALRLRIRRTAEKTARSVRPDTSLSGAAGEGALPNPVPVALAGEPDRHRYATQRPETERRELRLATRVSERTDSDAENAEIGEESVVPGSSSNAGAPLPNAKSNSTRETQTAGG